MFVKVEAATFLPYDASMHRSSSSVMPPSRKKSLGQGLRRVQGGQKLSSCSRGGLSELLRGLLNPLEKSIRVKG